jgi:Mg-chelatase subunit ChlI
MSSAMRLLDVIPSDDDVAPAGNGIGIADHPAHHACYPFAALVGQDELKNALLIAAVDSTVGGVLIFGDRGTGKSTAVRALAALLPPIEVVEECPYACAPDSQAPCPYCATQPNRRSRVVQVPIVDLPLGATEDRVLGALDIEDRFGMCIEIQTPRDIAERVEIIRRRDAYERDPRGFSAAWRNESARIADTIVAARGRLDQVEVPDVTIERCARLCAALGTDGLRGELTLVRAGRALASLNDRPSVGIAEIKAVALACLRHRLRRGPLEEAGSDARLHRVVAEHLGA